MTYLSIMGVIFNRKNIKLQSVVLRAEEGKILNKEEMIEKILDANIIVISICFSTINELNTILRSEGIYADLILRQEYGNIDSNLKHCCPITKLQHFSIFIGCF